MSGPLPSSTAQIVSIASAHPPFRMTRAEWLAIADLISPAEVDRAVLARLADRSGIDTRWCAAFEDGLQGFYRQDERPGTAARMRLWSRAARSMSLEACRSALARGAIDPADITHVVTASCTGFDAPGIDAHLVEQLGLRRGVERLNIGFMGCHAAINALAAARALALSDPRATVLVATAEVSSAHFHHSARLDQLVANTLFADGATAMVVAADAPRGAVATIAGTHATLLPGCAADMAWTVGDHGFEMTLGARVPDILAHEIRDWVASSLAAHGLAIADVRGWAIHPGGPRVIDAVASALGLAGSATEPSRAVLRDHGNMSSATLPFILERLARAHVPSPWVGLAFGPGLAGEMLVCRGVPVAG